jgi:DNA-binding NarL/FixJ family response regulator
MAGTTILLLDPDAGARARFRSLIAGTKYQVIAEATNGDAAVAAYEKTPAHLVVMDISAPGHEQSSGDGGLHILKRLQAHDPKVRVVLTFTVDTQYLVMAGISSGAVSRLRKPFRDTAQVLDALAKAELARDPRDAASAGGVRLKKPLMVRFKKDSDGLLTRMRQVVSEDISPTGIAMRVPESVPEKTLLRLEIELPGRCTVKTKAQVVRSKAVPGLPLFEVACAFVDTAPKDLQEIKQYIISAVSGGGMR